MFLFNRNILLGIMRIIHLCLAAFYNENYAYQENCLSIFNKLKGHDVKIIASTEVFDNNGKLKCIEPEKYVNNYGVSVVRLPYKKKIPRNMMRKIRIFKGLYNEIEKFKPDIIFCHALQTLELKTIVRYKQDNRDVKLYADNHADFNNSAQSFWSKNLLHRLIYLPQVRKYVNEFEKVYYISTETKEFLIELYKMDQKKLEFLPLGGKIRENNEYKMLRKKIRDRLQIHEDDILLLHSGKMDRGKKTLEILKAMSQNKKTNIKLVIIGVFEPNYKRDVFPYIHNDSRVYYEGWKSGEELSEYLCAADVYIQPGTQSATLQSALCSRCTAIVAPHKSYIDLCGDSVIYVKNEIELVKILNQLNVEEVMYYQEHSFKIAKKILDYEKQAEKYVDYNLNG